MIDDGARRVAAQVDELLEQVVDEFGRLQTLREALETFIEQPGQQLGSEPAQASQGALADRGVPAANAAVNQPRTRLPSPTTPPKEQGTGGAIEQPGSPARSAANERSRDGRRAAAASAVVPPAVSSSGSVGTSATPVSHVCPEAGCDFTSSSTIGLGVHRTRKHPDAPVSLIHGNTDTPDRREINELCPKGCGRRFMWEPAMLSHVGSCKGKPA